MPSPNMDEDENQQPQVQPQDQNSNAASILTNSQFQPGGTMDNLFGPVRPGDENVYPNSLRNVAVSGLGLPDSWRQSLADQKVANQNLPAQMGTTGTIAEAPSISSLAQGLTNKVPTAAGQAAMEFSPEMTSAIQQMASNPKAPVQVSGPVNGQLFQKLRDYFGHTGPVIMK